MSSLSRCRMQVQRLDKPGLHLLPEQRASSALHDRRIQRSCPKVCFSPLTKPNLTLTYYDQLMKHMNVVFLAWLQNGTWKNGSTIVQLHYVSRSNRAGNTALDWAKLKVGMTTRWFLNEYSNSRFLINNNFDLHWKWINTHAYYYRAGKILMSVNIFPLKFHNEPISYAFNNFTIPNNNLNLFSFKGTRHE